MSEEEKPRPGGWGGGAAIHSWLWEAPLTDTVLTLLRCDAHISLQQALLKGFLLSPAAALRVF